MSLINQLLKETRLSSKNAQDGIESEFGIIQKIHGHFYYIKKNTENCVEGIDEFIPLTLPTRMQKENISVYVGDVVEVNLANQTIKSVIPRKSLLPRPKVANVDLAIIVISTIEPAIELEHLDRLLCHAGISLPCKPINCLTKIDLLNDLNILKEYKDLGYEIFPVCNKTGQGFSQLRIHLINSLSVLAGHSGVGKSSLIKSLCPEYKIEVGEVSKKTTKGTHTTRHTQIFEVSCAEGNFQMLDTPGFSRLDSQVSIADICSTKAFPEIGLINELCGFADCKHLDEADCKVVFSESRKASYRKLMEEADRWEIMQVEEKKEIGNVKVSGSGSRIPILRDSQRTMSRKSVKQMNKDIEVAEDESEELEDDE